MVELRSPFPAEDIPRIWAWTDPFRWRISDDFSPKTLAEFIPFFRALVERGRSWAVYVGGELGGVINYEQASPIVGSFHCIFKRSFWGRNTTATALRMAFPEMFAMCEKLTIPVVTGNRSMISLLTSLGATKEGVLKAHTRRDGKPVDLALMAFHKASLTAQDGLTAQEGKAA